MILDFIKNKKILRPIQGLILSFGAPLGWMIIQSIYGNNPVEDLLENTGLYIYLSTGTALAFLIFGYYVGTNEENLENLALIDPLTGLYNNRYFHERLHQEFAFAMRNKQTLSIALFDIDHFKAINDRHGHLAGDQVLQSVGKNMRRSSRAGETIARVGGEEICVILPNCPKERALQAAERLRAAISNIRGKFKDGTEINVTASAGVTSANTTSFQGNEWDLYATADKAMYEAKANGRDQVVYL